MFCYTFRLKNGKYKSVFGWGLALIKGKAIIREARGHWNGNFDETGSPLYLYSKERKVVYDRELLESIDGKPFTLFK